VPWRLKKAEDVLRGKPVTAALVRQAADAALAEASPLRENGYKTDLVFAALKQAVEAVTA
jgi:xanthine dehydrogenase YagS FAD-binding subunit